jgi:hypothetical protein
LAAQSASAFNEMATQAAKKLLFLTRNKPEYRKLTIED